MNSYTEDKMVSIAEVRVAFKAEQAEPADCRTTFLSGMIDRLTKPPEPRLRDDCPVLYDYGEDGNFGVCVGQPGNTGAINIRPLIPEDAVLKMVSDVMPPGYQYSYADTVARMRKALTAYTTEPGDA